MKSEYGFELVEMVRFGEGDMVTTHDMREAVGRIIVDAIEHGKLAVLMDEALAKYEMHPLWTKLYWSAFGAMTTLESQADG